LDGFRHAPGFCRGRVLFLAGCILATSGLAADTLTLEIRPSADTSLIEVKPDNNTGAQPFVMAATTQNFTRNHGLFQFDVAGQLPAGATVTSASVAFEVTRQPVDGYDIGHFGLYRMLVSWGEGTREAESVFSPGLGAPAQLGEATWNHRFAGTAQTWAAPGGLAGTDYVAVPSSQEYVYVTFFSPYVFLSSEMMVSDVQLWLDHPQANFGWMLNVEDEGPNFTARRFASREAGNELSPRLIIEYTPVPEPGSLCLLLGAGLALAFRSRRP